MQIDLRAGLKTVAALLILAPALLATSAKAEDPAPAVPRDLCFTPDAISMEQRMAACSIALQTKPTAQEAALTSRPLRLYGRARDLFSDPPAQSHPPSLPRR